jgi:hypothetical protein
MCHSTALFGVPASRLHQPLLPPTSARRTSSRRPPLPHPPSKLLFYGFLLLFSMFFYWVLLCCYLQLNSIHLGFRLFICVGYLVSAVLSLNLFGFLESWIRSKFLFLSLFEFFGSQIKSKFIGILLLLMILSILVGHTAMALIGYIPK